MHSQKEKETNQQSKSELSLLMNLRKLIQLVMQKSQQSKLMAPKELLTQTQN
jgi:hypothetical protein